MSQRKEPLRITVVGMDDRALATFQMYLQGPCKNRAVVDYGPGANIWTLWSFDFDPPGPGEYEIALRVTDESGRVADMGDGTDRLQGYDGAQRITFRCV